MIDLIAKLKTQYPQVHAVVVGGADVKKAAYLQELKRNIQDKHLTEAITFVGHRSDMREWLAFSDIVLSLSNQAETFGRTALEALSVGTPVIGWKRGGVAEILSQLYPQGLIEVDDQSDIVHVRSRVPAWLTHFALKGIPAEKRPHLISTVHGFYSINHVS